MSGRGAAAVFCAALAFAVYWNALGNGFALDDVVVIEQNAAVHSLDSIPSFYRQFQWGGYRPVALTTYALDWAIWDGRPFGFHLTNVVLHALVTALVVLLLGRFLPVAAALAGGAVFAVHPVHVEAVANVVGRAELLAAAAFLMALGLHAAGTRPLERGGPGAGSIFLIAVLYAAGILSKETAITLPLAVFLIDAARADLQVSRLGEYFARRVATYGALAVGAAAALGARFLAVGAAGFEGAPPAFHGGADLATRVFTMLTVWPHYVRLLVAPIQLSPDYSPAVIVPVDHLTTAGIYGLGLVAAILGLAALAWRRTPWAAAGPFWSAITLLPVSNVFFVSGILLAERTLYLPSVGVALVAAGLTEPVVFYGRRYLRVAWGLAAAAAVVAFARWTVLQNPVWMSTETVVEAVTEVFPTSYRGHWLRGNMLAWSGERDAALSEYGVAADLWPHDPRMWVDLAGQNLRWERWRAAEQAARRAVEVAPHSRGARQMLARVLYEAGRMEEARTEALRGLAAVGADPSLYAILSASYRRQGRYAEAARAWRAALTRDTWQGWLELARLRAAAGDTAAAFATLDTAGGFVALAAAQDSIEETRLRLLRRR